MKDFFIHLGERFLQFISQYSYFLDPDYYGGLFEKYFSVAGFIIGAVFVLLIFFSTVDDKKRKTGFVKIVVVIALINSCGILATFLNDFFHQGRLLNGVELVHNAPDNIISGFVLTLVVSSCYRNNSFEAFLFGVAVHAALPLLHFEVFTGDMMTITILVLIVLRVALMGVTCVIISNRKRFYIGWCWYFACYMLLRVLYFVVPLLVTFLKENWVAKSRYSLQAIGQYLSQFTLDTVLFGVILLFAIVFETGIVYRKLRPVW